MTRSKTFVRVVIVTAIVAICAVEGQILNRRLIQRQQKQQQPTQSNEQEANLEKQQKQQQLLPTNVAEIAAGQMSINHAIIESIFDIPIQAIKSVNELLKVLASTRAQLRLNRFRNSRANDDSELQQAANASDNVQ